MDIYSNGVNVTAEATIAQNAANLAMDDAARTSKGMMAGGSDAAVAAIKDYLQAQDNPDDAEKLKTIKDTVDPENKLDGEEIISILDSLLKKAGKKWDNSRINTALCLVLTLNAVHSFTSSLNDNGNKNRDTKGDTSTKA